MIPLVDLGLQLDSIKNEIINKITEVLESKEYIQGKYVNTFEKEFAKLNRSKYCIGCSSGTSAIFISLKTLKIKNNDEVITVPNTFIATAEAISHTGAKPVFVDIDPDTYNIDTKKIESAITPKTKAIIPVHLYGNPVKMDELVKIAKSYKLEIIEDCAQAHLSSYNNKPVGTFGIAGAFSFFPGKNLGAYGDAGAIITDSEEFQSIAKKLTNHGRKEKYIHNIIGYNHRLDGIQAAILSVKMKYLKEWTKKRQENAKFYSNFLSNNKNIKLPVVEQKGKHVFHLFVIQVNNRNELIEYLKNKGIACSIHYPIPLHLQKAFQFLGYKKNDFPIAENISDRIISLPMFPELTKEQILYICEHINKKAE